MSFEMNAAMRLWGKLAYIKIGQSGDSIEMPRSDATNITDLYGQMQSHKNLLIIETNRDYPSPSPRIFSTNFEHQNNI